MLINITHSQFLTALCGILRSGHQTQKSLVCKRYDKLCLSCDFNVCLFQWNSRGLSYVFLSASVEVWRVVWQLTALQGVEFPLWHLNPIPLIILTDAFLPNELLLRSP